MISPPVVLFLSTTIFENPYSWESLQTYTAAQEAIKPFLDAIDEKDKLVTKCASFDYKFTEADDSYVFEMYLASYHPDAGYYNVKKTHPRVFAHVYEQVLTHSALLLDHGRVTVELRTNKTEIYIKLEPHLATESIHGPH